MKSRRERMTRARIRYDHVFLVRDAFKRDETTSVMKGRDDSLVVCVVCFVCVWCNEPTYKLSERKQAKQARELLQLNQTQRVGQEHLTNFGTQRARSLPPSLGWRRRKKLSEVSDKKRGETSLSFSKCPVEWNRWVERERERASNETQEWVPDGDRSVKMNTEYKAEWLVSVVSIRKRNYCMEITFVLRTAQVTWKRRRVRETIESPVVISPIVRRQEKLKRIQITAVREVCLEWVSDLKKQNYWKV